VIECVDDPSGLAIDPSQVCGYDPYFDPEPVVADVATMQAGIDAAVVEAAAIEALYASSAAACQAERSAFLGSAFGFGWKAGEAIWWAWTRNVPKTYTSVRDASLLWGATYSLYLRYKDCMRNARGGGDA
jgi:hypothetical protein